MFLQFLLHFIGVVYPAVQDGGRFMAHYLHPVG
jgi:hypothetical protein